MDNKFLCVMLGYDKETERILSGIQKELYLAGYVGTQTKNLAYHITLGIYDVEEENQMIEHVKNVASKTSSFEITFNHIGIFGGSKVLFIAPDTNKELLELKDNFGGIFNWTAHTTMLIDEPEIIYKALPIVAKNFSAFKGKVETIHLYEFRPMRKILSISLINGENQNVR